MTNSGKSLYPKYHCKVGNPLACGLPVETLQEQPGAVECKACGFPTVLPLETKIYGNRGSYQIERFLGYRGWGRLYQALQLTDRQVVVIKEYLLPKLYFITAEEAKARKDAFVKVGGISLADGRVQDLRLVTPTEAVADTYQERCYMVTQGNLDTHPTLETYLAQNGAMSEGQVRQLLKQVLQSLEFLHGQKFRLPSGLVQQGLTHGNLSLDSLLIVPTFQGFYIYLCDLALWEHQFLPPLSQPLTYSPTQDLRDLGYIAFFALAGRTVEPITGQPLDPTVEAHWTPVNPAVRAFITRLIGIETLPFESAENARHALFKLPPELELPPPTVPLIVEEPQRKRRSRTPFYILGAVVLLLLGILGVYLLVRSRQRTAIASESLLCCIEEVPDVPPGSFTYTAPPDGIWAAVRQQKNLITNQQTLETELLKQHPDVQVTFQPLREGQEAIAPEEILNRLLTQIQSPPTAFAITSLTDNLTADVGYQEFARDSLVVFVAFSYARRDNSLPQRLNGRITFEQLRRLYTGEITNWRQLGGPNLEVKLYIPTNDEAVRLFEERVLQDNDSIEKFRGLIAQNNQPANSFTRSNQPTITRLRTFNTLQEVIRDFETRNTGSISFGSLSQVFGQCSVYPLALAESFNPPVAPLLQYNQPITPATDLCNDKGGYAPNVQDIVSKRYPLSYSLAVVYPRDNRRPPVGEKFAEILRTEEAQRLLTQVGLIPIQPLSDEESGGAGEMR